MLTGLFNASHAHPSGPHHRLRPGDRVLDDFPPLELLETRTIRAMEMAGVDPAVIYAFEETGFLVGDDSESKLTPAKIAAWEAAISEFERLSGHQAAHRRINPELFLQCWRPVRPHHHGTSDDLARQGFVQSGQK